MRVITGIDWSVYVIGGEKAKPLKIGIAKTINSRLASLQTGNHEELYEYYSINGLSKHEARLIERSVHKALEHRRVKGEWFDVFLDEAREAIEARVNTRVRAARLLTKLDTREHMSSVDRHKIEEVARQHCLATAII